MNSSSCHYDCANPPDRLTSNADISGIGVSLAYTVTAGLSVGIVLVYYFFMFRSDIHVLSIQQRHATARHPEYQTNPIDQHLLRWRLKSNAKASPSGGEDQGRWPRSRDALEHCMLLISDLQMITGLAVIICGFSQLRCGISAYHWKRVVQLAWFSSVTHLCCLTFLRDYFHKRKSAQLWRVPGTIILIILLIAALVLTMHYAFNDLDAMVISRPRPHDYAICFLSHHEVLSQSEVDNLFSDGRRQYVRSRASSEFKTSKDRVICSSVLLAFGVLNRLWRLYDAPTVHYLRLRAWWGEKLMVQLEKLFLATKPERVSPSWLTILIYCPVLALVLGLRVLLDIATSKTFEVWWLLISFAWGTSDLWPFKVKVHEPGSNEWTFGQMIAILVLIAPIVTLAESSLEGVIWRQSKQASETVSTTESTPLDALPTTSDVHAQPPPCVPATHISRLHPARRFYSESLSFQAAVWSGLFAIVWGSGWILYILSSWDKTSLTFGPLDFTDVWPSPPIMLAMFFVCLLFALTLELPTPPSRLGRNVLGTIYFLVYTFFIASTALYQSVTYLEYTSGYHLVEELCLGIFISYLGLCVFLVHKDHVYACMRVWRDVRLHWDVSR